MKYLEFNLCENYSRKEVFENILSFVTGETCVGQVSEHLSQ